MSGFNELELAIKRVNTFDHDDLRTIVDLVESNEQDMIEACKINSDDWQEPVCVYD